MFEKAVNSFVTFLAAIGFCGTVAGVAIVAYKIGEDVGEAKANRKISKNTYTNRTHTFMQD